jgi:hypothetical protein
VRLVAPIGVLCLLASPYSSATPRKPAPAYSFQLPLAFEANDGQTDDRVEFLARGPGYNLFLTGTEAVFTFPQRRAVSARPPVHMQLVGSAAQPRVQGEGALAGKVNYFRGRESARWRTQVPTYQRVKYSEVYPGVDLVYYGDGKQLEYDFIVSAGADPDGIAFAFDGVERATVDAQGDLVLDSAGGDPLRFRKPVIYQAEGAQRREIEGSYVRRGEHQIGFHVGAYDRAKPLIIDPVLNYSTYLGGSDFDSGSSIAVDATGAVYVAGITASIDFPTVNAVQSSRVAGNQRDLFVAKLTPDGTALVYATYLGGSDYEFNADIAVDPAGAAYVIASTASADFPTVNAFQPAFHGDRDAVVAKLSADGSRLVYSTYLGGNRFDLGNAIAVDLTGAAYLAGVTLSDDFPLACPIQSFISGSDDVFVAKLAPDGRSLVYSTYLGSSLNESAGGIGVDSLGEAYVVGMAEASDFPSVNPLPFPTLIQNPDAFAAKFAPDGKRLIYSIRFGGDTDDFANGVAIDASGAAYITGYTYSADFPTTHALQSKLASAGESDAFVVKIAPEGGAMIYGTFLGGALSDSGTAIAVDAVGSAYVGGSTESSDFPTANPLQPAAGKLDAVLAKIDPQGAPLVYSTHLGGGQDDSALGVTIDLVGGVYIVGQTGSQDFPTTPGAVQPLFGGSTPRNNAVDAFVVKIAEDAIAPATATVSPASLPTIEKPSLARSGGGALELPSLMLLAMFAFAAVKRRGRDTESSLGD